MIKVGEYIRTKRGYITKILKCLGKDIGYKNMQHYDVDHWTPYQGFIIYEEDIKAHSKNIIDLIEVGDYVNGYRVTGIMSGYVYLDKINAETRKVKTFADYQIETILTHELYEQDSYKVVE
jgi:hypothetical protein